LQNDIANIPDTIGELLKEKYALFYFLIAGDCLKVKKEGNSDLLCIAPTDPK